MIKIFHGENLVESRKALVEAIEKATLDGLEINRLNGSKLSLADVRSTLQSDSLLGKNRLLVIENFLSSSKSKEKQKITDFLKSGTFENDLILWEEKEIKGTSLPPKADARIFKVSQSLFPFLDSIGQKLSAETLELLASVKRQEAPEMIFYMLIRQFRYLILAKEHQLQLPDWQRNKFERQASYFTLDELKNIYQKLLEIDYAQKTSSDPYLLTSRLDLLIAGL